MSDPLTFFFTATMRLTFVIFTEISEQLVRGLKMNPCDFGDPMTFPVAPPEGPKFNLSNTSVYDNAKLLTSPSASAILVLLISKC